MGRARRSRLGVLTVALTVLVAGLASLSSAAAADAGGYWLLGADGSVYEFGGARILGSAPASASPVVAFTPTPSGRGYWIASESGKVTAVGDAGSFGSTNHRIVGLAARPSGDGYWLVSAAGAVYPFGAAVSFGSMAGRSLNSPVVGMASTASGRGYWLVAADGGIFAFGDAGFYGSRGNVRLNSPIVGMAATEDGRGYWLVAADGGIFAFGNAAFYGSTGNQRLDRPIVGFATTPSRHGYWMTDTHGQIFPFGDAVAVGDARDCPVPAAVVAVAASGPGTVSPAPAPRPNCGLASAPTGEGPAFTIGLIGDTGYDTSQDAKLLKVRAQMATMPLSFVVHDGDTKVGTTPCTDARDQYVYGVFNGFAAPFIYTPGDNEWRDCADPLGRLAFLRSLFFSTGNSLGKQTLPLTRQKPTYVENARWTVGNVVFATVNVPGGSGKSSSSSETSARLSADTAWVHAAFDQAEANHSPGVMIIMQDDPFDGSAPAGVMTAIKNRTVAFGKPVVVVHGNGHTYKLDHPWSSVSNFTRLETYGTANTDKWVRATVDPSSSSVFTFTTMRT